MGYFCKGSNNQICTTPRRHYTQQSYIQRRYSGRSNQCSAEKARVNVVSLDLKNRESMIMYKGRNPLGELVEQFVASLVVFYIPLVQQLPTCMS